MCGGVGVLRWIEDMNEPKMLIYLNIFKYIISKHVNTFDKLKVVYVVNVL